MIIIFETKRDKYFYGSSFFCDCDFFATNYTNANGTKAYNTHAFANRTKFLQKRVVMHCSVYQHKNVVFY